MVSFNNKKKERKGKERKGKERKGKEINEGSGKIK
jgi:hypothetical protein